MKSEPIKIFKKLKSKIAVALVFLTATFCVYSEISFESLDLNDKNKVLFSVNHKINGRPSYSTAFMADVSTLSDIKILSCYPEKMELLCGGAILQLRNRYGTARYNIHDSNLSWSSRTSSISAFSEEQVPQKVSPDGKWICYVKKTDFSKGELILKNALTLQETVIHTNAVFDSEDVNVLWNPDSNCFLYEKDETIYFCDPKAAFQKIQMTENYRKIGKGLIQNVVWQNEKNLIYINRDLVYKISTNELYTRGLYSNIVGIGTVVGRLPIAFNNLKDSFSVDESGKFLVLIQANKIISKFLISSGGFEYLTPVFSKPIVEIDGNAISTQIFWTPESYCLIWVEYLGFPEGIKKANVYSANSSLELITSIEDPLSPKISSDKRKICFKSKDSLNVYSIENWINLGKLEGEKIISYVWASPSSIFAGGESTVRHWKLSSKNSSEETKLLFLSSIKNIKWKSSEAVIAEDYSQKGKFYDLNLASLTWSESQSKNIKSEGKTQNGLYRVFAGTTPNENFLNTLYVRTLSGKAVTKPLFPETSTKSLPLKKVYLIFDAIDDSSGLNKVISVLKKYNIDATFFMNGEFIRRYPKEILQIVNSGFDCASLFFTNTDLTKNDFVVDEDFIRRGLARNEDEFFNATGKELSIFWHAPYFKANDSIKEYSKNCGYRYVEAGRFSLDTITLEMAAVGVPGYLSANQMISFYAENCTSKSIIPVSLGLSNGTRKDYLWEKLDLLISTLLNNGFEFDSLKNY